MKIVVINPILYTCETSFIKKVKSIKDSMIYNLCLEMKKQGHEPILIAANDYEPVPKEKYDFKVIFLETTMHKLFKPNCFPFMKKLGKTLKNECKGFDFIISSEVFMMSSLYVSCKYKKKTIIWHELAKHNNIMKKIPSKIWYNIIARLFFRNTRIVPRSQNALDFIRKYCNNVSDDYIDHGVDINEFNYNKNKDNQFIVVSQLIQRKHIEGIISAFSDYLEDYKNTKLLIIGSGDKELELKEQVKKLNIEKKVLFLGQMSHSDIIPLLSKSMAMLINTEKDNSMLSIVESIATGTPVITTDVPYNKAYIKKEKLGIVTKGISKQDLILMKENNIFYINNCINYREFVSNKYHVEQFIREYDKL